ncbi:MULTISPECIES: tRNA 2-thiocytidine(32) synthetase TtcA [Legionella]|uniref:tRNA-cytidine(32) 2-sulfurtransferase n=1 Tax=Legionella septentrionalis TaxID=2498109 RepID=A0A433JMF9_9GAMM|nr:MULTISPECIES: tRNA 2-thiocytidine(32) synthetase TtcA [Legionella]MCP0913051.1 tRNA 2-thiocytidine(32) synthetase TtcA [Legionella sp. 27cVA30]RUQ91505.1 tRNA 2-thiocytidine(32) synthetase TtcA [Legionella septentrionalis]RUQ98530.1 tRNA 2-thiocytidine(32) synthetase TtcA [Legionella septentrionalis]RUR10955.1 tRNA 2-thiocytidine(32) synthetase TtcA [Legionella septentrionalis]RUR14591.1 tRNA 2-thiocytidine(32) synthetase TtcA [Legionella septentrionalis]
MASAPSPTEKKLLHYTGKAIADFNMIQRGDRVMLCLSGGKDSFTLLTLLHTLRIRSNKKFELFAFTLDQAQPGWDDSRLRAWLQERSIPHEILSRDTYSIVKEKIPEGKTYCSLCSRLRRGIIYRYAEEHGYNKIALGHHRDDLVRTLLMSILYNGDIRSMPPKLLSDNKKHIVIRPMCYVQERDIITFAEEQNFPIIPCNLCGSQENLARKRIGRLIDQLAEENPKVPSNILHALQSIKPSQLMDQALWNFKDLEKSINQVEEPAAEALYSPADFAAETE